MLTVLLRIVSYGFKNFFRNVLLSTATLAVMILALLVLLGLILFNVSTDRAVASIQDKIDISVYFKTNAPEDKILQIKESLEGLAEIKTVEYISRDRALEIFKERHQDDPLIIQAVNTLNVNPLEASLNVKAQKPDQYASIAEYLSASNLQEFVDTVSYSNNQVVIDRLTAIINTVNRGGLVISILFAAVAGLMVLNTTRLAIYSNRDEIGIMRVVGAANSLVRGPFMVEGIITGVLAAALSLIVAAPAIYFTSPYLNVFIPKLNIFQYFYTNLGLLFLYQLAFGIVVGSLSSFVAVRRYLKN